MSVTTAPADHRPQAKSTVLRHLAPRLGPPTPHQPGPHDLRLPIGITGVTYQLGAGVHVDGHVLTGTRRHLSDLLTAASAQPPARHLLHEAVRINGFDPVLYDAYRDILPPRRGAGSAHGWFTDLVVYHPGTLPNGEPMRSIGHWNTPSQLEIFQGLSGEVMMIIAGLRPDGTRFCLQHRCTPGQVVVVPFGAWHLTYALDGPAAVVNLYADHRDSTRSSRRAAMNPQLKYGAGQAPVALAARRDRFSSTVIGTLSALRTWGMPAQGGRPRWLQPFLPTDGRLGDLFLDADDAHLAALMDTAWENR